MIHDIIVKFLQWLYETIACGNLFASIILLTIAVRIILFPLFYKSSKDQLVMRRINPELEAIRKDKKKDREVQAREMMDLYKKNKLNPFSGILVLIVQLPIFFALFRIFRDSELLESLFNDGSVFIGISLTEPNIIVSVIAAAIQYINGRMTMSGTNMPGGDKAKRFNNILICLMPVLTLLILTKLPAALGIYWTASTVFSIIQTLVIKRKLAYSDTQYGREQSADTAAKPDKTNGLQ